MCIVQSTLNQPENFSINKEDLDIKSSLVKYKEGLYVLLNILFVLLPLYNVKLLKHTFSIRLFTSDLGDTMSIITKKTTYLVLKENIT